MTKIVERCYRYAVDIDLERFFDTVNHSTLIDILQRLRMCIWKSWKRVRTRIPNLIRCGIDKWHAYQWGNTSKGYWRIAESWILTRAIGNKAVELGGGAGGARGCRNGRGGSDNLCRARFAAMRREAVQEI